VPRDAQLGLGIGLRVGSRVRQKEFHFLEILRVTGDGCPYLGYRCMLRQLLRPATGGQQWSRIVGGVVVLVVIAGTRIYRLIPQPDTIGILVTFILWQYVVYVICVE